MLQIIPITNRTKKTIDTDTVKYIDNSIADSMTGKYNYAIQLFLDSNEDIICFRHDDTELREPLNVIEYKLEKLFTDKNIAVAGLIGTIALDSYCAWWNGVPSAGGRSNYGCGRIIQGSIRQKIENNQPIIDNEGKPVFEKIEFPMNDFPGQYDYMATVDGCCMFFPKWFFQKGFRFDENLKNYHFYDSDICLQALAAGYKVSTVDITVKHESIGSLPPDWENLKQVFFDKWNSIVNGAWPISRLSKFNMSNYKKEPNNATTEEN